MSAGAVTGSAGPPLVSRLRAAWALLRLSWRRCCVCVQGSPMLCLIITPLAFLILLLIAIFNVCLARLLTAPGAVLFNLGVLWLVLRLVVRVLVFPGSILLWRRNTEASYRSEMAKQFAGHLEHLRGFLAEATGKGQGPAAGATLEGTLLGFMVVEGLSRNFQVQQRDQVKFTKEQAQLRSWVQAVELWLSQAKVMDRRAEIPLNDWLQRQSQNVVKVPLRYAVNSSPLASSALAEAEGCLQRLEQMLHMFYDLQRSPDGLCASTRRFLSTPPVGSLNQLRAELLLRYSAQHYWVRTQGRKIDAVFISAKGSGHLGEDSPEGKEDMPLKEPDESPGPVVVWCNPNAAYYETMAYESHWLDFYLSQGCSIFVFNYSGFGRSEGAPTPGRLSADGEAVVDFLRRRGFTQVAVHGRSIGGIAACRIAKNNPDIVKVLVADRTFSTLSRAAKFTFGDWAAKGLALSATWADNVSNYLQARCYKVMLCDPKDLTIPDLAALRSSVAQQVLDQVPPGDRLAYEGVERMAEAWCFFEVLVGVCDGDSCDGHQCACHPRAEKRGGGSARQPVVGKPADEEAVEEDVRLVALSRVASSQVNAQWLQEHGDFVRAAMAPHIDLLRQALDSLGSRFNSSGLTLDDAVGGRTQEETAEALRCFLCNLQVWGSLAQRGAAGEFTPSRAVDEDIELLLARGLNGGAAAAVRLGRLAAQLTPQRLADYHRQMARFGVAKARRDFRQYMTVLQRNLEASVAQNECPLSGAVLQHLREVESFLTTIYRFFKCVDMGGGEERTEGGDVRQSVSSPPEAASDDSEEGPKTAPKPSLDRGVAGYVACLNCGHNGVLSEGEAQHLALHLRSARFGKYAGEELEGGV